MTIAAIIEEKAGRGAGETVTVTSDMAVRDVVALLAARRIGAVPVMANGTLAGIFSERDLVHHIAAGGEAMLDRPVGEVMTATPITVERSVPILHALGTMTKRRIRHLPVVEEGALIGLVSIGDLVKMRIDRIEAEAAAMRDYIQSS